MRLNDLWSGRRDHSFTRVSGNPRAEREREREKNGVHSASFLFRYLVLHASSLLLLYPYHTVRPSEPPRCVTKCFEESELGNRRFGSYSSSSSPSSCSSPSCWPPEGRRARKWLAPREVGRRSLDGCSVCLRCGRGMTPLRLCFVAASGEFPTPLTLSTIADALLHVPRLWPQAFDVFSFSPWISCCCCFPFCVRLRIDHLHQWRYIF